METKKWWESKAVWGGIIAVGSAAAGLFGFTVDEATQEQAVGYVMAVVGAAGGLLAIYGRVKAEKKIGK